MKLSKKSIATLFMVFVMVFSLAACGGSNNANHSNNSNNNTANDGGQNQEVDKEPEKITLKYYHYFEESENIQAQIDKFQQLNPHITVEQIAPVPGNSVETLRKLDILMSADEQVDIISLPSVDEVTLRASKNVLEPLDEYFEKHNLNPNEEYVSNPTYDGEIYATILTPSYWYVMLNKDHLDEAGLPVPEMGWTWDDFKSYAKQLTKGEGNDKRYGAYFHTWGEYANPILFTERSHPYMADQETPIFDDASFDYWFKLREEMEEDDQSARPLTDLLGAQTHYASEFFSEKASMVMIGSWTIKYVNDLENYPHDFVTAFAPVPRSSNEVEEGLTIIGGSYNAIAKSSKHKDEAFEFLRFITSEGNQGFGIPGWKKADGEEAVNELIGEGEHLYDKASLIDTLFNPKVHAHAPADFTIPYGKELKSVLEDGLAHYLLDDTTVEEAKQWMMEEANKVIENNK